MVIWFFCSPTQIAGSFKWHDPPYGKFLRTLILDLRNKIWELKAEANVTTNEEHLQEEEEIMPQIEEMAKVPTKMMEDFAPQRKKCASCSSFTYFVLTLVLGSSLASYLVNRSRFKYQFIMYRAEICHFCTTIIKLNAR